MPKNILLVEDDHSQGQLVQTFLEKLGHQVKWARNGRDALRVFDEKRPDLIVTDVNMPLMDGIKLCQSIKKRELAFPIIMMSAANEAYRIDEDMPESFRPDVFLLKPFQLRRLKSEMERLIGAGKRPQEGPDETPTLDVQEGSLENLPFSRIMVFLYKAQRTGYLELSLLGSRTVIYFIGGYPVYVRDRQISNSLGQLLLNAGAITEEEYWAALEEYALSKLKKTDQLLGEIIIQKGYAGPLVISEALRRQVKEKLIFCFMIYKGEYRFVDDDSFTEEILTYRMNPVEILMEGIDFAFSRDLLSREMERYGERYIFFDETMTAPLETLNLSEEERRTLETVDGTRTLNRVAAAAPLQPTEALKLCYPLILLGVLQTSLEPRPTQVELPEKRPAREATGTDKLAEQIVGKYLEVKHQNFFDMLEVSREDSEEKIRSQFRRMVKEFHPNMLGDEVDGELRDHATEVYSRLVHAYRVLTDTDKRQSYLDKLESAAR